LKSRSDLDLVLDCIIEVTVLGATLLVVAIAVTQAIGIAVVMDLVVVSTVHLGFDHADLVILVVLRLSIRGWDGTGTGGILLDTATLDLVQI